MPTHSPARGQRNAIERGDFTGTSGNAGAIASGDAAEFEGERGHAAMCVHARRQSVTMALRATTEKVRLG